MRRNVFLGWLALFGSVLACAGSLIGCRNDSLPIGSISGKITYRGMPLTKGGVLFVNSETGIGASGELDGEGNYRIISLNTGKYQVAVQHPRTPTPEELEQGVKAVRLFLPQKFFDPQKSGLTFTVVEGENRADFAF